MNEDTRPLMVTIRCMTYNHEPYIRQCLEGFVMQKTNFRFEAIVHDDASTDGTAAIVKEYAEKYPDIIKPIVETENQYSKHDGSLSRIMNEHTHGKYMAICEGDDYWIDPLKLQKQVDVLETHPECSMVCSRTKLYSEKRKRYIGETYCRTTTGYVSQKEIVLKGGLYIATCSIVYRKTIMDTYPDYCKQCHVGDYPLQIMAAMKGRVYYLNDIESVYRVENSSSWIGRNLNVSIDKLIKNTKSEVIMLQGFCSDYPMYEKWFKDRISFYINMKLPIYNSKTDIHQYLHSFDNEIREYSFGWRLDLAIRLQRMKLLCRLWTHFYTPKFRKYFRRTYKNSSVPMR